MHTLENIDFLRMVVLSKQLVYGGILVELVEILLGGDVGFKSLQFLSNDSANTFK